MGTKKGERGGGGDISINKFLGSAWAITAFAGVKQAKHYRWLPILLAYHDA